MTTPRIVAITPFFLFLTPALADVTTSGLVDPDTLTPGTYIGQVSIGDDTQPGSLTVDNSSTLVIDNSSRVDRTNYGIEMRHPASSIVVSNATFEVLGFVGLEIIGGGTVAVSNSIFEAHGNHALGVVDGATVSFDAGSQVLLNGNGGSVRSLYIGSSPGTSIVSADGAGTFVDIVGRIGIGSDHGGGIGRLSLSNGATAVHDWAGSHTFISFLTGRRSTGELLINSGSELNTVVPIKMIGVGGGNGYVEVTGSSLFDLTASVNVGGGMGTAEFLIDNSTLNISEDPAFAWLGSGSAFVGMGPDGSTGTLTLNNGSVATIQNELHISYQGFAPTPGTGHVSVCNSTLNAPEIFVGPMGSLSGTTINGNITVNGGSIQPGCSPGTMTVNGNVEFNGGTLVVELTGPGSADLLNVSGSTTLAEGTTVVFSYQNGHSPSAGESIDFLETGILVLPPNPEDVTVEFEGLVEDIDFDLSDSGDGFVFTPNEDGAPDFVEPHIDIRPEEPNDLNPGSNQLFPVAILTTQDAPIFDAALVDPATIQFGPNGAMPTPNKTQLKDVDGDGDLDMRLWFRIVQTGIACGDVSADLTGFTNAGTAIAATDSVNTVGCP